MNKKISGIKVSVIVILALLGILSVTDTKSVKANPSFFTEGKSASASTTLSFLSPGNGTTTVTFNPTLDGNFAALNDGGTVLLGQFTSSSTAPTLKFRREISQDGIDWYPDSVVLASNATTTALAGNFGEYSISFATTTDNVNNPPGSGTNIRLHFSIAIASPTRYTRFVFYVPAGGVNGGLWAHFVGKKENR